MPALPRWIATAALARLLLDPAHAHAAAPPRLDVLFVVDNSGSTAEAQAALVDAFPTLIGALAQGHAGRPDLHIGVVSSNVGVGGFDLPACPGNGDDGALQHAPHPATCATPTDAFIKDVLAADGTTREQNFSGDLAAVFGCIASLGTLGCGFEQHLESMKRALDDHLPGNTGFLRDDAHLLVVILADEDDCSAIDSAIFNPDPASEAALGPFASFRCSEFGVECSEGRVTRAASSYHACRPRTDSFLRDPADYAAFVRTLKPDPNQVLVATIIAAPTPFDVRLGRNDAPELQPSCTSLDVGVAFPGVRLDAFARGFGGHGLTLSICTGDLRPALAQIGARAASALAGELPAEPDAGPNAGQPQQPQDGCGCRIAGAAPARAPLGTLVLLVVLVCAYARRAPSPRGTRRSSRPSTNTRPSASTRASSSSA